MHRPRFLRNDKLPLVAIAAGLMLIVGALVPWGDLFGHDNPGASAASYRSPDTGLFSTDEPLTDLEDGGKSSKDSKGPSKKPSKDLTDGLANPFSRSFGSNRLHTVTLRIVSDGAVNVGYRYRGGEGDGQQLANRSLTLTRTVRGPLPVAQVAVQVLSNATYAKCSISIDGIVVNSYTASGGGYVAVCTD